MEMLGLFLDAMIILLLFGTIIFAAKLSLNLKAFRDSRSQFDTLIRDLDTRIAAAEGTILGLRNAAQESGSLLQEQIDDAQNLHDELSLMTQAADNMAQRLEQSASGGGARRKGEPDIEEARIYDLDSKKSVASADDDAPKKFEERLRRIEEKENELPSESVFETEAERDLAEALKAKPRGRKG